LVKIKDIFIIRIKIMIKEELLEKLKKIYPDKLIEIENNRFIIYVDSMKEQLTIPNFIDNHQILIHYMSYKNATKSNFIEIHKSYEQKIEIEEEIDINVLIETINKLLDKENCSVNVLETILFEIQDGDNAVTSLSNFYPYVLETLKKMFDIYGLDIIYEELQSRNNTNQ
jgi:hypothetical protein